MEKDKIKEILDRDCLNKKPHRVCEANDSRTPCWVCHRNDAVANELYEASKLQEVAGGHANRY